MFAVIFLKSHSKRYDDPAEMGRDIAEWLKLHPARSVKIEATDLLPLSRILNDFAAGKPLERS